MKETHNTGRYYLLAKVGSFLILCHVSIAMKNFQRTAQTHITLFWRSRYQLLRVLDLPQLQHHSPKDDLWLAQISSYDADCTIIIITLTNFFLNAVEPA